MEKRAYEVTVDKRFLYGVFKVNARHGLINFGDTPNFGPSPSELEPPILDSISMPQRTVGPTSAVSNSNRTAIKDISITHLKVEFRNMVSNMKPGRKTSNSKT